MPTPPSICRVHVYTTNLSGVPEEGVQVQFTLTSDKSVETTGGYFVKPEVITIAGTDASGHGYADLIVSAELEPDDLGDPPTYRAVCKAYRIDAQIVVPNAASADLIDLIPN